MISGYLSLIFGPQVSTGGLPVIRLNLHASHRHILPVLTLCCLVVLLGDPARIAIALGDQRKATECDCRFAAQNCIILTTTAIAVFYFGLAIVNAMRSKTNPFGEKFFGWHIEPDSAMWLVIKLGIILSYFAFVCRIVQIAVVEALFLIVLFPTSATDHQIAISDFSNCAQRWYSLLVIILICVHVFVERSRLGRRALAIKEDGNLEAGAS